MDDVSCVFCRIIKKEIPSQTVFQTDDVIAFHDIAKAAPVHILIVPKKHIASINHMDEQYALLTSAMMMAAQKIAASMPELEPGYRLVINTGADAGQTVWHLHMHMIGGRKLSWPPG